MSSVIEDVCQMLDSYSGRDKVVRLACYACKLYGCLIADKDWQNASSKLSGARMMLRLFDDVPTFVNTYSYGLGKDETSTSSAMLGVFSNIVDQVYLPVEKACWLYDVGVLKLTEKTADTLDTSSTVLWATSLFIALLQTSKSARTLWWSRDCLQNTSEDGGAEAKKNLDVRLALETVVAFKLCLDITHAVSYLPRGWLWGERIGSTKIAFIATMSSVLGIALYFAKKRMLK